MTLWSEPDVIERIVGELWAALYGGAPLVMVTERSIPFEQALPWIALADVAGDTLWVAWGEPLSHPSIISRTAHIARRIFGSELGRCFQVSDSSGIVSPLHQREIVLNTSGASLRAWVAHPNGVRYGAGISPITERILTASAVPIALAVVGVTVELVRGAVIFFEGIALRSLGRGVYSRLWERRAGEIVVEVGEPMKRGEVEIPQLFDEGVVVEIDIGAFEMKLGELVALRPGATVTLPCGREVRGILKLEGAELGFVTLEFREDSLVATVEELTLFPGITVGAKKEGNSLRKSPSIPVGPRSLESIGPAYELEEL